MAHYCRTTQYAEAGNGIRASHVAGENSSIEPPTAGLVKSEMPEGLP